MAIRKVRVGDIIRLQRTRITPKVDENYRPIGVYSWGKGIIENEPISGADLSKVSYYRFPGDALILSNIQAWEAAIAVSDGRHTEFISSQRFLPYVPVAKGGVDVRYLLHFFLSDPGMALIRSASPGTVTRNRTLGIKSFEDLVVPLPDLNVQHGIASKLDSALNSAALATSQLESAVSIYDNLERALINQYMAASSVSLGELAEINPRPSRNLPDQVHFVPMADVDEVTGTIAGKQLVKRSDLGSGYKQFLVGDIIFARITPCMQNGKSAVFDGKQSTVGYGSTEFHVLRAKMPTLNLNIHRLLRTRWLRDLGKLQFTGTAGQQRVPADFLRTLVLPDLTTAVGSEMAAKLNAIDCDRRRLLRLIRHRTALQRAFPQAARNEVFSKLL